LLALMLASGDRGMTLDDMEDAMPDVKMVSFSSIPARLCDEYLIHRSTDVRTGRSGRSGREQLVYKPGMGDAGTRLDRQQRARTTAAAPEPVEVTDAMLARFKELLWVACVVDPSEPVILQPASRFADYAIRRALQHELGE
jgi:hypothetical protein